MSEYWFNIGNFVPTGAGWPKISGRRGRSHQLFFYSENYVKWSFVWFKNLDISFFRFVTIHTFDRQTDGRTDGRTDRILIAGPRLHCMQHGKNYAVGCRAKCVSMNSARQSAASSADWSRPSRFNDLALLACISYTYCTVSYSLTYSKSSTVFGCIAQSHIMTDKNGIGGHVGLYERHVHAHSGVLLT